MSPRRPSSTSVVSQCVNEPYRTLSACRVHTLVNAEHTGYLQHNSDELSKPRRLLLQIGRATPLLLGEYLRFGGRFHLCGLRGHRTILSRWVRRSICGCLDYLRLLDGRFGTRGIGSGIQADLTAHRVALAIGSNNVAIRWPPSSVSPRRRQMRLFVSPHMAVSSCKLRDHREFLGPDLPRSCIGLRGCSPRTGNTGRE